MNGEGRIQVGSGQFLCLTVDPDKEKASLDQLSLQDCVPNDKYQKWSFNNHPNKKTGQMRRMKNAGSGNCVGLRYATNYLGGKAISTWTCNKDVNEAMQMCNDMSKPGCLKSSLLETIAKQAKVVGGVKGPLKFTKVGGTSGIGGTTEYCMDVHGSIQKGAKIKAKACHGGEDQLWMYNMNGEGRIQVGSGQFLCLTVDPDKEKASLDQLSLQDCVPNDKYQKWSFNNHPNKKTGQMRRMKNAGSGNCVGLRYATNYLGGKAISTWGCNKDVNEAMQMCNDMSKPGCQKSSLLEYTAEATTEGGVKGVITATGVGGTTGVGLASEYYCLEVWGNKVTQVGQKVAFAKCNANKESQQWTFNQNGDNKLQIGPKYLCLTQKEATKTGAPATLTIEKCDAKPKKAGQAWSWQNGQQEGSRQIKNTATAQCMGVKYATGAGWGETMMATAWKCSWKKDKNTDFNLCNARDKLGCDKAMR